jgi:hypothetical protein
MMFKEIIALYSENHMKPTDTKSELPTFKAGGTYSYQ